MIFGTGVDIISISRVRDLVQKYGDRFLTRWFTPHEIAYCSGKHNPSIHYAARLAAKEAAVKALRVHWDNPMCWRDISVENTDRGVPELMVSSNVLAVSDLSKAIKVHLALSHCNEYAIATVIAEVSSTDVNQAQSGQLPIQVQ